jgi:hypothetical protein
MPRQAFCGTGKEGNQQGGATITHSNVEIIKVLTSSGKTTKREEEEKEKKI